MAMFTSQGSKLQVEISSVFNDIPQLLGFPFPGINTQYEDATTLDAAGNFKVYNPLMNDTDEITANGIWDPTNAVHDFLMDEAVKATKVLLNFKAIASDTGTATAAFSGYVSFKPVAEQNSSLKFSLSIRVSGAIVYTQ